MKIVIAETGIPPQGLGDVHGRYPGMMRALLDRAGYQPETMDIPVVHGDRLPAHHDFDGLLITGSPAGVYEDHDWIEPLAQAVRDWAASGKPVLGICFGHQMMAHALGGRVEKSNRGWGVGVHTYNVIGETGLPDQPIRISCALSHKDQVTELPPGAERLGGSAFCPNGIIRYGQGRALSFQMHPEFEHDFAEALLNARADSIPEDVAALARATYPHPTDRDLMGRWIASFFKGDLA